MSKETKIRKNKKVKLFETNFLCEIPEINVDNNISVSLFNPVTKILLRKTERYGSITFDMVFLSRSVQPVFLTLSNISLFSCFP